MINLEVSKMVREPTQPRMGAFSKRGAECTFEVRQRL